MSEINIEKYTERDKEEVIGMILLIQKDEFNVQINRNEQPDLEDIESYYGKGNSNFWIAKKNEQIIGTVALLDIGNSHAALRKMFVKKEFRGKQLGVGQLLLDNLLKWAKVKGVRKIFLGTTEKFIAAQRF
jgi:N-acetylglutamate synthase-like GNAT family acetyltransferase